MASLVAQRIKRLPVMHETRVRSLGWEDLLKKEMATHSSILAWKNLMDSPSLVGYPNDLATKQQQENKEGTFCLEV